jgi:hypothetical protein
LPKLGHASLDRIHVRPAQNAELQIARGADVDAIVYACGDSICMAADEKMTALLRKHRARLTVETVTDLKTAQAILDGTEKAYSLNIAEPTRQDLAEIMCGGDPEFMQVCLPHITRKRDDPWWNGVLLNAKLPEGLKLILDHGVDPDVRGGEALQLLTGFELSKAPLCPCDQPSARSRR